MAMTPMWENGEIMRLLYDR